MGTDVSGRRHKLNNRYGKIGLSLAGIALWGGYTGLALAQNSSAGGWNFQPSLTVTETYSDNINLAPAGQERSDWVTSISPRLSLQRKRPHLDLVFSYSPELLHYANGSNGTTIRNSLNGVAKAEVIEDKLFFDATAQISQQNASPFDTQAANSVNGSTNRTETRTLSFGPYYRSRFGGDGTYLVGYRYSRSDSDNDVLSLGNTNEFYASLSKGLGSKVSLSLDYGRQTSNYADLNDQRTEQLTGTLSYLVDSRLTLFVTAGQERNDYVTFTDEESDGSYYSAGFRWTPRPTTSISAQHGKHYYGNTDNIQLTHRTSRTVWRAGYSNGKTTSSQQLSLPANFSTAVLLDTLFLSRFPDPAARSQAVAALLQQSSLPNGQIQQFNFLTNQIFLQKRLDLSLALVGLHNTVTFGFNRSEQKALSAETIPLDIFARDRRFRTTSLNASWSYQLGPRTTGTLSAQQSRSEALDNADESRQRFFTLALHRQLQRKLSVSLLLRNTREDGNFLGAGYSENAIVGSLNLQF